MIYMLDGPSYYTYFYEIAWHEFSWVKKDLTLYWLGHLVMEHSHNGVVMNKMRTWWASPLQTIMVFLWVSDGYEVFCPLR